MRVFVNPGGTFDLSTDKFDRIGDLAITGGAVTMGGGTLTVGGTTSMTGGSITGTGTPSLKLLGNVVASSSASGSATIAAPASLNGARTFTISDGPMPEDLSVTSTIENDMTEGSLSKAGAGTLALKPPSSNLYTGGTTIADGTLTTLAGSGRAIPVTGLVTVGNGAGDASSAVLRFGINNDIDGATNVAVRPDGRVDLNGFVQSIASLTMTGGLLDGAGTVRVNSVSATSSSAGPARIAPVNLSPRPSTTDGIVFNVPAGTELQVSTAINPGSAMAATLTKTGTGAMTFSGTNALPAGTDVQAGTLTMNGTQTKPVSVGSSGTLAGTGSVGATTVAGTLAPGSPSLRTTDLTFSPTGSLAIAGPPSSALPRVDVTGTTTIQPGARFGAALGADPIAATGSQLPLIGNDAGDTITGQFANAPEGFGFAGGSGQAFTLGYGLGDGNDLALTAGDSPGTPDPGPSGPGTSGQTPGTSGPPPDTRKPKLKFTVAKTQKLARKGTFAVRLTCDEACTATVVTGVKPPARGAKNRTASRSVKLEAGKTLKVQIAVPRKALSAVRKALKRHHSVKVMLSARARDVAGNTSSRATRKVTLKR